MFVPTLRERIFAKRKLGGVLVGSGMVGGPKVDLCIQGGSGVRSWDEYALLELLVTLGIVEGTPSCLPRSIRTTRGNNIANRGLVR